MKLISHRNYLIILLIILSNVNVFSQSEQWTLEKNEDGIKVYTRQSDESPIKEFKATTTINADINKLIEVFNNVKDYPKWMADCKYAETLKRVNDNIRYDYIEAEVPYPLENRDIIFWYKSSFKDSIYVAEIISQPDYIEPKEGITRIKEAKGKWILSEKRKNEIAVTYQFLGDPEGNIPAWVTNLFIVDGPYTTLKNLKEMFN